ncbi:tyrosine-type recombinase/integrase [Actinomadura sp. NPDC048955]|uniref:tyrosine-type recombinase/integrase n=1 Tax=Actinomadura sp. NPDC048955 TaxID=3158228 RepID=UPI0033DBEB3B
MTDARLVAAGRSVPAAAVPPLLHDALTALDADLGERCVGWADLTEPSGRARKQRVYRRRLELLAEALEPATLPVVVGWLSSARRTSVATRRGYCDDLLTIWAPLARELGHDRFFVGCLSTAHLQMWRARVTGRAARPLTARSIARYVKTLSSLHAYAAGVLDPPPPNPVSEDVRPVIDEEDPSTATPILEEDEVAAVFAAARSGASPGPHHGPDRAQLRDLALVTLLYVVAGRVSEICAADIEDLRTSGDRSFLRVRRKGHQVRDLEIPPTLAGLLRAYLGDRTTGPLLLDDAGRRLDRHDADRISTRLGRAAGVLGGDHLTPHVWRASRITHLLDALEQAGGEERVMAGLHHVMIYANHKDPKTTLRYWIRRSKARKNAELSRTGEELLVDLVPNWLHSDLPEQTTH